MTSAALCARLHKVEIYGVLKETTLYTNPSYSCPQWEEAMPEKVLYGASEIEAIEDGVEDDPPEEWETKEVKTSE